MFPLALSTRVSTPALLLALALPLAAFSARADEAAPVADKPEVWINVGGFSRHFDRSSQYNERNFGFGIEWRHSPEVAVMAGVYDNSLGKPSQYAAVNWQPWQIGPVKLGAALGLLNGYPGIERGGTFFAALPMASIEGKRFGINLGLIPSMKNVDGAVLLQFKIRLM
ncbi:MAG: hypothetical protein IBJ14_08520 [Hydrogenophaga sp.]|nr:hypothetical protein [Hydrogenophaga sp.]